jgi:hypothetical protein
MRSLYSVTSPRAKVPSAVAPSDGVARRARTLALLTGLESVGGRSLPGPATKKITTRVLQPLVEEECAYDNIR